MDPLSAIGLTTSILELAGAASKLAFNSWEIYQSQGGALESSNASLLTVRCQLAECDKIIKREKGHELSEDDRALLDLAIWCKKYSEKYVSIVDDLKGKGRPNLGRSVLLAVRCMLKQGQLNDLKGQIVLIREQMCVCTGASTL